ncbi:NusG domain II-containing protein [Thermoanaerobacterium thermosaccharolyticum]|uniref:NusG domain II-containing protein n=1 Tax=Thermoanaerobacterium thermosaccharolyticum TaxID=1517 RepID=UPI003DA80943
MKIGDKILIGVLLVISLISGYFTYYKAFNKTGTNVVIEVNGFKYQELPLNVDKTVTIHNGKHINVVEIKNGKVRMKESDCPDQICVKTGWIEKEGQQIVCLPNRVVVRVAGGKKGEVDDIVY